MERKSPLKRSLVSLLALFVVIGTVYLLIRPASTWERKLTCGLEEHVHTEECYSEVTREVVSTVPTCGMETGGHIHGEDCYTTVTVQICGESECAPHTHTLDCYEEHVTQVLICDEAESEEHTHSSECYETKNEEICTCGSTETAGHKHMEECFKDEEILICPEEECVAPIDHIHSESCYATVSVTEKELICSLTEHTHNESCYEPVPDEDEGFFCGYVSHQHNDLCYFEDGSLMCTVEEHTHELICESDSEADKESSENWQRLGSTLGFTGIWEEDIVTLARSQIGYTPSSRNFLVENENEKIGYNRYGAWNNDPYIRNWNVPFAAFCVDVTGVNASIFPVVSNSANEWLERLSLYGLYYEKAMADIYQPKPGDIVFFDTLAEDDKNEADRVGVIAGVTADGEGNALSIEVIEGDVNNAVATKEYSVNDSMILGYGEMPVNPLMYGAQLANVNPLVEGVPIEDETALAAISGTRVYLNKDITVSTSIIINGDTTLDLNGHTITSSAETLFDVQGGTFIIKDTSANAAVTREVVAEIPYGHLATYENGILTYYQTETAVSDPALGLTWEKLIGVTVSGAGMIIGGGSENARCITISGGTVDLLGGYIVNFSSENDGGAIQMTGGTLNQMGAVIAANTAARGGAICVNNATLNISGGVISGNVATAHAAEGDATNSGGGGVYAINGTVNMTAGYVTNNQANAGGYFDGGGAFLLRNSTLNLSGGYLTGNQASGGGAIKTWRNGQGVVNMTGGFITANNTTRAEGGGVNLDSRGLLYVNIPSDSANKAYVTNNIAGGGIGDTSYQHWGGGGLFCCDGDAVIYLSNALIDNNHAGGFGGGVAGCSTGRININVTPGGAIYDNDALGMQMAGGESAKHDDSTYALRDPVFNENGYNDYFCALSSTVHGGMLGGGAANWTGSADGEAITSHDSTDILKAAYIMGLTAHPAPRDRAAAQEKAQIFITGNVSPTHGGGVLCNGYLSIGDTEVVSFARVQLEAAKDLIGKDGKRVDLGERVFTFLVEDEHGTIASIGHNDASGQIMFDRKLAFTSEGTFTYLIYEEETSTPGVLVDTSRYQMVVEIAKPDSVDLSGGLKKVVYRVKHITITELESGKVVYDQEPENNETRAIVMDPTGGAAFTNHEIDEVSVTVSKTWNDDNQSHDPIEVKLYQDSQLMEFQNDSGYSSTVTLSSENFWRYTWEGLPAGHLYTVEETPVSGYVPTYRSMYETTEGAHITVSNAARLFVLDEVHEQFVPANSIDPAKKYIFVSPDGSKVLCESGQHYDGQLVESDTQSITPDDHGNYSSQGIPSAAVFTIVEANDGRKFFLSGYNWSNKQSYLLAENGFKSTTATTYASGAQLDHEGYIKFQNGFGSDKRYTRFLIYDESQHRFTTSNEVTEKTMESLASANKLIYITNTPTQDVTFTMNVLKVDEGNTRRVLPGAEFQLRQFGKPMAFIWDESSGRYQYTSDINAEGADITLVTGQNGYIRVDGIPGGDYQLVETNPPVGHKVKGTGVYAVHFNETVLNQTIFLQIENPESDYILPETGGSGSIVFSITGMVLMLSAFFLAFRKKKQGERY